jgi:hypothetical protein
MAATRLFIAIGAGLLTLLVLARLLRISEFTDVVAAVRGRTRRLFAR